MKVSIVICARNEEKNLDRLFIALQQQKTNFDWELIFVNDFSCDQTALKIKNFIHNHSNATLIDLEEVLKEANAYIPNKKIGIQLAIEQAKGEWIVTTDADCLFSQNWLQSTIDKAVHTNADLLCSPVIFSRENTIGTIFQQLDMIALQAATSWSIKNHLPILSNGANLAYKKTIYVEIKPYENNLQESSGDDIFLLQACVKSNKKVGYNLESESIVWTNPSNSIIDFIHQRVRWAGKSSGYQNTKVSFFLVGLFVFNLSLLSMFVLSIFKPAYWCLFFALYGSKTIIDILILLPQARFFCKTRLLIWMPLIECMHIFYVVFVGLLSLKKTYRWKGRSISRNR